MPIFAGVYAYNPLRSCLCFFVQEIFLRKFAP